MRLYGGNAFGSYSSALLFTFIQDTQCYALFYFQPLDEASFVILRVSAACFGHHQVAATL
jgi:hypothetical protein